LSPREAEAAPSTGAVGAITERLNELVERTRSITALLISHEGSSIAEAGNTASLNTTALAALIAGMFTATREIARMVGEHQFSILLNQGESRHIQISLVGDHALMVVVFEDYASIGRVRFEARRLGLEIQTLLDTRLSEQVIREDISLPQFKQYALNLIDRIFVTKA
jgi:predicted regulator of Ras-like GTPase activity (Roadblock/LC7/MglB family)